MSAGNKPPQTQTARIKDEAVTDATHGGSMGLTKEALRALPEAYTELWLLGDLVNYGPEPNAVVEFIRATRSTSAEMFCTSAIQSGESGGQLPYSGSEGVA